jgi:U3 small nucleolar RNA-associated protein 10
VKKVLSDENAEKASAARLLLSAIQQRHPDAFQRATKAGQDEDEEQKQAIDQIVLSLSLVHPFLHRDVPGFTSRIL